MSIKLYPSTMCVDFDRLREEISMMDEAGADGFHVDIMDGRFVKNLAPLLNLTHVRKFTQKPLGVHLMVENPFIYLPHVYECNPEVIYIHYELPEREKYLDDIRAHGVQVGLVVNPGTIYSDFKHLLPMIDKLLVMRVTPGFIGQKNIPEVEDKIDQLVNMPNRSFEIALDGCVTKEVIRRWSSMGVERFVCGMASMIFEEKNKTVASYRKALSILKDYSIG